MHSKTIFHHERFRVGRQLPVEPVLMVRPGAREIAHEPPRAVQRDDRALVNDRIAQSTIAVVLRDEQCDRRPAATDGILFQRNDPVGSACPVPSISSVLCAAVPRKRFRSGVAAG